PSPLPLWLPRYAGGVPEGGGEEVRGRGGTRAGRGGGIDKGQETVCRARFGENTSDGKAHLETDALIFRGGVRGSDPVKEVQQVEAQGGHLRVVFSGGELDLELGRPAEKWAEKIRSPKGRLDKLGVKLNSRVAVLGVRDETFFQELGQRTKDVTRA